MACSYVHCLVPRAEKRALYMHCLWQISVYTYHIIQIVAVATINFRLAQERLAQERLLIEGSSYSRAAFNNFILILCGAIDNNSRTKNFVRGSLTTSQISHLLLYPSLWLLLSGLSSQFLPLLPIQPAFIINSSWQYL